VDAIKLVDDDQMTRVSRTWLLPGDTLFAPLAADPRWPKFSASYRYYTKSEYDKHAFAASMGKTFSLLRSGLGESVVTELGLQASVFPIFDLDTPSFDLINADYFFAIPVTFQFTGATVMARLSHMSSHLGDEYLLDNPELERINLSYETLDVLGSFEPNNWFRLYGGGGYIISADPTKYGRWTYQGGVELRVLSDYKSVPDLLIAVDAKGLEETYYTPSVTVTVGLEVMRRATLSFEVHDGYSPNGQFYNEKVTWVGVGVHLY
jgi:hypothetical protein